MKKEFLKLMSESELNEYATIIGASEEVAAAKSKSKKIDLIEKAREHEAVVDVIGLSLHIPKKRMYDKRISVLVNTSSPSDADLAEAMSLILGEEQMSLVIEACTDEDGVLDTAALALVYVRITTSDELKN